ncbi:serpin family protein [bacterium]|nr:serpin family protein [bacterium]
MIKILKNYSILVLSLMFLLIMSCDICEIDNNEKIPPRELSVFEEQLVSSDNIFGIKLFKALNDAEPDSNLFISPLSVSMALGMALNGAADSTYEAMKNTLELNGLSETEINQAYKDLIELLVNLDKKVVMQIANSIWYRDNFTVEPDFIDVNKTYFDAEVQALDFDDANAPNIINNWVDENTNGLIKKIIDGDIPPEIVMYLINAVYFKGTWTYEFDEKDTKDELFNNYDNSISTIPLMLQEADFPYFETDDFQVVDLPYGDSLFTMTVILPKDGEDINEIAKTIDNDTWINWTNQLYTNEVKVYLPKFTLEWESSLVDVLVTLGMGIAFDPYQADFSRINPNPYGVENLYISDVIHKAIVKVNEEGTEAAAVTSVEFGLTSIPQIVEIRIDHPFIFAIRERYSGTILFMGKVLSL